MYPLGNKFESAGLATSPQNGLDAPGPREREKEETQEEGETTTKKQKARPRMARAEL